MQSEACLAELGDEAEPVQRGPAVALGQGARTEVTRLPQVHRHRSAFRVPQRGNEEVYSSTWSALTQCDSRRADRPVDAGRR